MANHQPIARTDDGALAHVRLGRALQRRLAAHVARRNAAAVNPITRSSVIRAALADFLDREEARR